LSLVVEVSAEEGHGKWAHLLANMTPLGQTCPEFHCDLNIISCNIFAVYVHKMDCMLHAKSIPVARRL
jgi:hypothetical protein